MFNTQTVQSEEKVTALRKELRRKLAKKEADINIHSKQISDLQQQLQKVRSLINLMSKKVTGHVHFLLAGSGDECTKSIAIQTAGRANRV